jgi:hypothetical protein
VIEAIDLQQVRHEVVVVVQYEELVPGQGRLNSESAEAVLDVLGRDLAGLVAVPNKCALGRELL